MSAVVEKPVVKYRWFCSIDPR